MAPDTEARSGNYVRAVERALNVVRSFGSAAPSQSLSEVAAATGLDRATARRLLLTLQELGYVRSEGRLFELTPRVLGLGYAYLSGMSLVEIARPHLQRIAQDLGETASLTVLDGDEVVYVELATSSRLSTVQINVGTRFRAHPTSMGRVLLAGIPEQRLEEYLTRLSSDERHERTVRSVDELRQEIATTRTRGWATVDQELEEGLRGVAVPVRDRSGVTIAAVNVSAHAGRRTIEELAEDYLPVIVRAVADIEAELLGYRAVGVS